MVKPVGHLTTDNHLASSDGCVIIINEVTNMNNLERAAQKIRQRIQNTAQHNGFTECELVAEIFKQTLDPTGEHTCDGCHATWLELYVKLEEVMK